MKILTFPLIYQLSWVELTNLHPAFFHLLPNKKPWEFCTVDILAEVTDFQTDEPSKKVLITES